MTQLQRQLRTVYPHLPMDVQNALVDENLSINVEGIGRKLTLDDDQIATLTRIVVRILGGIISPKDLIKEIAERLEIPASDATLLAQEINKTIFTPIKESLIKVHSAASLSPAMRQVAQGVLPGLTMPPKDSSPGQKIDQTGAQQQQGTGVSGTAPHMRSVQPPPGLPSLSHNSGPNSPHAPLNTPVNTFDPSPRSVIKPQSPLGEKLGSQYRIDPGLPAYGFPSVPTGAIQAHEARYYPPATNPTPSDPSGLPVVAPPQATPTIQNSRYFPPTEQNAANISSGVTQNNITKTPAPVDPYREVPTLGDNASTPLVAPTPATRSTSNMRNFADNRGPNRYNV